MITKCQDGKCDEFCSEFNLNRFTPMFDGEPETLKDLVMNANQIF